MPGLASTKMVCQSLPSITRRVQSRFSSSALISS